MQLKSYLVITGEQTVVSGSKGWVTKEAVEKRLRVLGTLFTPECFGHSLHSIKAPQEA